MESFTLKQIGAATAPYAISPIPGPKTRDTTSLVTKIFGIRAAPDLGILTTSLGAKSDTPIVQRSWGLLGGNKFYGPNFHFHEVCDSFKDCTVLKHSIFADSAYVNIEINSRN